jgi:putative transcriptional regulator
MVIFMEKLRELRLKNKFTNQLMADILKISKPYYWQIEHDQKRLSYDMAVRIAGIFHLKPDELFYDEFKEKAD